MAKFTTKVLHTSGKVVLCVDSDDDEFHQFHHSEVFNDVDDATTLAYFIDDVLLFAREHDPFFLCLKVVRNVGADSVRYGDGYSVLLYDTLKASAITLEFSSISAAKCARNMIEFVLCFDANSH